MDNIQSTGEPAVATKTSGLAIASLVLGILGFCTFGLAGIVGLILGIIGLITVRQSAGQLKGQGLAIAGIVVSAVSLVMLFFAILMVILTLAIHRAREVARAVPLMANTKQLCLAMIMYCEDNEGKFPNSDNWPVLLSDYIEDEKILTSPFDPDAGRAYAMNDWLNERKISEIQEISMTVLLFEARFGSPPAGGQELLPDEPQALIGYVIGFGDGHVEFVPPERIEQLIWSP